jgi:hypothetical protein
MSGEFGVSFPAGSAGGSAPANLQYVLDGDLTPTIPAAGGEIRCKLGVDTDGTTYSGITAARAVNAPTGATPVDGQLFSVEIYDDGTARNVTFNAAFTPDGVAMASNIVVSNGTLHKNCVVSGRYNKAAAKWQVRGINYEQ